MKLNGNKALYRYLFITVAIFIAIGSLIISNILVKDLSKEERSKIEIWAKATKEAASDAESQNMSLILSIIEGNQTIPVILHDKKENLFTSVNIDLPQEKRQDFLRSKAIKFSRKHEPIMIKVEGFEQYVYYDDSYTLKRLQTYPYIQLGVMFIFLITSLMAVLNTKRMEQDRLWVGLTKETAHQLGTPISSLMAWTEYLRLKGIDNSIIENMEKDIDRLQMITDRFSKVGSAPDLEKENLNNIIKTTIGYLEARISKKITFNFNFPDTPLYANINEALFSWVIENLTKNAVDAMGGQGNITYYLSEKNQYIFIDIEDKGKGINKSKFKDIFSPGFTTKSRGWGLGLSLAKRIIEQYHKGKIYVKFSELYVGTVFRIELKKAE